MIINQIQDYERRIINDVLRMCSNWTYAYNDNDMKETDKIKMERLIKQLEWFNNFADYLEANNINMYNESCDYADNKERYDIF